MKRLFLVILLLTVSLTLFSEKLATLPDIYRPYYLALDDQNVYVTEGVHVFIFSRKDYSLKKKFGKEGQGPQEFVVPQGSGSVLMVHPQKDCIVINSPGKVSFFTKEGDYINEMKSPSGMFGGMFQPIGNQFAGLGLLSQKNQTMSVTINIYDKKLKKLKQVYSRPFFSRGHLEFPMVAPVFYVSDNKIITPGEQKKFEINILDANGDRLASINREYHLLKVTKEYEEGVFEYFRTNPQTRNAYEMIKKVITFADEFPAIQGFFVDNQKIYIVTYLKKDKNSEFFVYDMKGNLLKRLFLPMAFQNPFLPCPTNVKDNKLYQVIENLEEEVWELHAIEIM